MDVYRELYYKLFAAMADAAEALENGKPLAAKNLLIAAQREAEERFLSAEGAADIEEESPKDE